MELVIHNDKEVGIVMTREEAMIVLALVALDGDLYRDAEKMRKQLGKPRLLRWNRRAVVSDCFAFLTDNGNKGIVLFNSDIGDYKMKETACWIYEKIKKPKT